VVNDDQAAEVRRMVNLILTEAALLDASEIRLSPDDEKVTVFYHIHGEWTERDHPPRSLWEAVRARICSLAKIDLRSQAAVQSGTISVKLDQFRFHIGALIDSDERGGAIHLTLVR
jgi:type II secretory ATPase GspE/PulE/Tfp pilus assembly ATPase PilB-like protein